MHDELAVRMRRDQRHRLLQGYPMRPLMAEATHDPWPIRDARRPLLVGVLPHPFCNPRVKGCGFCTFPHERFTNEGARTVTRAVATEIRRHAGVAGVEVVEGLYLGGGTANLTPPDAFEELCGAIGESFDLSGAEVSFEGVPKYFLTRNARLLRTLVERLPARHHRVSMGVQTLDPAWIERMGRRGFGDASTVERVIETAQGLGMTTSVDLLMNLPGQPVGDTLADLARADAMGVDQICLYHLVLFEGLGTPWSKDPSLVQLRKPTEAACAAWLEARAFLLARGFVQTTLTNFERREVNASSKRFVYELASFAPWQRDALGFGPGAISTVHDVSLRTGESQPHKWINIAEGARYAEAIEEGAGHVARDFSYAYREDRGLLYATRGLARGWIDLAEIERDLGYRAKLVFDTCEAEGLLTRDGTLVRLTPRGMFYADSVTGLLAADRAAQIGRRRNGASNDARHAVMG